MDFCPRFDLLFTFECVGLACIWFSVRSSSSVALISLSFIFHIFLSWSLSGWISLPANLLFLISVILFNRSTWTFRVSSFPVLISLRVAVWMLGRLHTK